MTSVHGHEAERLPRLRRIGRARPENIDTVLPARILLFTIGCYAGLIFPLMLRAAGNGANDEGGSAVNQAIWVLLGGASIGLMLMRYKPAALSRVGRTHLFALALIAWFVLSTVWSLSPEATIRRVILQVIIIASVTSCMVAISNARVVCDDILYFFALATVVNWLAVVALPPTPIGYAGVYLSKNNFGAFAALMVLFALPRIFAPGVLIRSVAAFVLASGIVFLVISKAKTSMGLSVLVPALSLVLLLLGRLSRVNLAVLTGAFILGVFVIVGTIIDIVGVSSEDFLTFVFGDPTFTNRTFIWDFAGKFIAMRPWQGYGFGGFWQIGDASPVLHAGAAWMTGAINQAHNFYFDLMLQGGYVALGLFLLQLCLTVSSGSRLSGWHLSDRVTVLGVIYYSALYNFFDTTLYRSFNPEWIYFIIASVAIGLGSYAGEGPVTASTRGEASAATTRR